MLTQNGNRWVGTGHNTVLTDYSGQDWIVYHAVDRTDPYYAGDVGYTKRPALIDPLDWQQRLADRPRRSGTVGQPAARAGRAARRADRLPARGSRPTRGRPAPTGRCRTTFRSSTLSSQWTWVRPPAAGSYRLDDGQLRWQTQNADLHPPATPLASVLTEPAPRGNYVVETKVRVTVPPEGCCQNYVQGGLVIYNDDGNYLKLASVSIWNTRQTEFGKEVSPVPAGYPNYGNAVVGPVGDWTYLRIVRHRGRSATPPTPAWTAGTGTRVRPGPRPATGRTPGSA